MNLLNDVSRKNINTDYRSFFDQEDDLQMYANGNSAYALIEGTQYFSKKEKAEFRSLMEGTIINSSLNFEAGMIKLNNDFELSKELEEYFKIVKSSSVNSDMLTYGLTDNPMGSHVN